MNKQIFKNNKKLDRVRRRIADVKNEDQSKNNLIKELQQKLDNLQNDYKQLEEEKQKIFCELQNEKEKNINSENEVSKLKQQINNLQNVIQLAGITLQKKKAK